MWSSEMTFFLSFARGVSFKKINVCIHANIVYRCFNFAYYVKAKN